MDVCIYLINIIKRLLCVRRCFGISYNMVNKVGIVLGFKEFIY